MESSSQDKNLPATERKLEKAREQGQVARSKDMGHLAILGSGVLCLLVLVPFYIERLEQTFASQLIFNAQTIASPANVWYTVQNMLNLGLTIALSFAFIALLASVLSTLMAGGWVMTFQPVMPDFNRINPLAGFGRLFSKEHLIDLIKVMIIAGILVAVTYNYLLDQINQFFSLSQQPSISGIISFGQLIASALTLMLLVIVVVALIDVPLQRFLFDQRMRMSREEIKQEHKESDGDPYMKGQRRARAREIANRASTRDVPKADFVVMNPTHYAVALRYDDDAMNAPQVISKGTDLLAFKIKDIANDHDIPVLQSPVLARALYTHAELNQEIPSALYGAVAQILAYVYRLKAAMRGQATMPLAMPEPYVPPELDPHFGRAPEAQTV